MPRDLGSRGRNRRRREHAAPARPQRAPRAKPALALNGRAEVSSREARLETRIARGLIAAFGLALLVVAIGFHTIGDYFTETDFYGAYAEGARLIQHGHLVPSRYGVIGPVYEIVLGFVGFLVPDLYLAARLISVLACVATLWLWFRLLAARLNTRLALAAVAFLAVNGQLFRYGHSATTDALAIALECAALLLLFGARNRRAMLLAGVVGALAFLTRYSAAVLLPGGLIAIFARGTSAERRREAALAFAGGFLLPVVPWIAYSLASGSGFSFQLHHNIAYEVFARARGLTWDQYQQQLQPQFHNLWDVIARDPGAVARRMVANVGDHLRRDAGQLLDWPVAIAAALGVLLAIADGTLKRLWPLLVTGALFFLILVPAFYAERYSLAVLPFYATLAGVAVASPRLAIVFGRRHLWLKPALALIPLTLTLQSSIRLQRWVLSELPTEVIGAGHMLRSLRAPGDGVIARKSHISWLGGVRAVPFPFANTLPEFAAYAQREHARWLFISWPEVETRPTWYHLLDTTAVIPGLTPRAVTHPPHDRLNPVPDSSGFERTAVLYEIGPGFGQIPAWMHNDTLVAYHNARAQLLVNRNTVKALITVGVVERARGRYTLARGLLERAVVVEPGNASARIVLGQVLLDLGDPDAAGESFDHALEIDPSSVDARVGRGWASLMTGRDRDAAEAWRPVVPEVRDEPTLQAMAGVYRKIGEATTAAEAEAMLARLGGAR